MLLNDRTPIEQFDVNGPFDFSDQVHRLRTTSAKSRWIRVPICRRRSRPSTKRKTDHKLAVANGSTDPTVSFDVGRNPPIDAILRRRM